MDDNNIDIGAATGEAEIAATEEPVQSIDIDTISMSKSEYEKALQSAEDKVRNKLYKQIKELELKLSEYEQPEKSDADKEFELRVAKIEKREKAVALKEELHSHNLDRSFADYLQTDDVDVESFSQLVEKVLVERMKAQGYVPSAHPNNSGITSEEWGQLPYSEQVKIFNENPDLAKRFL